LKFCYDTNKDVQLNALFSLGLICSGSNNSRIAGQMRQLASYHSADTNPLMILRISQGLVHMGKGLMSLNPVYSQGFLINNVALAGLLISILSFTEVENLICGKYQFLIYGLCLAMRPRMTMLVFYIYSFYIFYYFNI
jgi:26S proteasome regulatory subunit N1